MDVYVVGTYDDERVYMAVSAVTTDKNKAEKLKEYLDSWTCNSGVIHKFNTDDIQNLLKEYEELDVKEKKRLPMMLSKKLNMKEKKRLVIRGYKNEHYGVVGERTNMRDKYGEILYVGDVVVVKPKSVALGDEVQFVVKQDGKYFVMGIEGRDQELEVGKVESYEYAQHGDKCGCLIIKEE